MFPELPGRTVVVRYRGVFPLAPTVLISGHSLFLMTAFLKSDSVTSTSGFFGVWLAVFGEGAVLATIARFRKAMPQRMDEGAKVLPKSRSYPTRRLKILAGPSSPKARGGSNALIAG